MRAHRYFSCLLALTLAGTSMAPGRDHETYSFSPAANEALEQGTGIKDQIRILTSILHDSAFVETDKIAAIVELGSLKQPAADMVLAEHITFHYTRNPYGLKIIYSPAKTALMDRGEAAVDTLMKFIGQHAPDNREEYNPIDFAVEVLVMIKGKGYSDFVKAYAADPKKSPETLRALNMYAISG